MYEKNKLKEYIKNSELRVFNKDIKVRLSKELAIKYLEEMIDNNDLTEEDNIDKLYELLPLTYINKEIKERIYTIKLSFYDMNIEKILDECYPHNGYYKDAYCIDDIHYDIIEILKMFKKDVGNIGISFSCLQNK